MRYPFLRPRPARLSTLTEGLAAIEASGWYSNHGPENTRFEQRLVATLFQGWGGAVTFCNGTVALMAAIRHQLERHRTASRRYALLPSFTFAAPAHAAVWNGLTPLFCDIHPDTWLASADAEAEALERHEGDVAVIIPQATFGNCPDLTRYEVLASAHGVPVVVDAASALGSSTSDGVQFGAGSSLPVVFSMHATKTFATAEGGVVYSTDTEMLADLRAMCNFGFRPARHTTMAGLNGKLSEVGALLANAKLDEFEAVVAHRNDVAARYRKSLDDGLVPQVMIGTRHAFQFFPVSLRGRREAERDAVVRRLADDGIEVATYFSPHLAEHPYFATCSAKGDLRVTEELAASIISLPMYDTLTVEDASQIAAAVVRTG